MKTERDDCRKMVPDVSCVRYWWDNTGLEDNWYCETYDAEGDRIDDSQKVWFPVKVDDYGPDQDNELETALREAFPGAEVRWDPAY
jgi:hypothetical protein